MYFTRSNSAGTRAGGRQRHAGTTEDAHSDRRGVPTGRKRGPLPCVTASQCATGSDGAQGLTADS